MSERCLADPSRAPRLRVATRNNDRAAINLEDDDQKLRSPLDLLPEWPKFKDSTTSLTMIGMISYHRIYHIIMM